MTATSASLTMATLATAAKARRIAAKRPALEVEIWTRIALWVQARADGTIRADLLADHATEAAAATRTAAASWAKAGFPSDGVAGEGASLISLARAVATYCQVFCDDKGAAHIALDAALHGRAAVDQERMRA